MTTVTETELLVGDGRTLHVYDTAPGAAERPAVFWHHGTPNTGEPPAPLFAAAERLGLRLLGHDRPAYGGSTRLTGRDVASAAADVAATAEALGIERLAVLGHSGGGPHALACAALLPERVAAAASVSGLAPFDAPGLDWFAGMHPAGAAELRAALAGAEALERALVEGEFDPGIFTAEDHAALSGPPWSWLLSVVGKAQAGGLDGMIDDDLAYVRPWGFAVEGIAAPVLLVHGAADRVVPVAHAEWLAAACPGAELWRRPGDGHISVLTAAEAALEWLAGQFA